MKEETKLKLVLISILWIIFFAVIVPMFFSNVGKLARDDDGIDNLMTVGISIFKSVYTAIFLIILCLLILMDEIGELLKKTKFGNWLLKPL